MLHLAGCLENTRWGLGRLENTRWGLGLIEEVLSTLVRWGHYIDRQYLEKQVF